ncbi:hypothetical protein [Mucilaginibacter panaciglaebae]|uniref:Tetratricopeptide repeat protein n=1 Tax=Mucilaginibacter panaciglaebae TaxID=502331 RepID=A0ABP7WVZ0_9SPHI
MPKYYLVRSFIFLLIFPISALAQVKDTLLSNGLSKTRYTKLLTGEVATFYQTQKWNEAIQAAQLAIATDSLTYAKNVNWHMIGVCRFKTNDFKGAINDLSHFVILKNLAFYDMQDAVEYKAKAHQVLGQLTQAAQTYELWDELYDYKTTGPQNAAVFYKGAGNNKKFKQLMGVVLFGAKHKADSVYLKSSDIWPMMDYAELLIMAGKNTEAIAVIKNHSISYAKSELTITSYLKAVARYLNGEKPILPLKNELAKLKRVNMWDFTMFDRWLDYSGLPPEKQRDILALQRIIEADDHLSR